MKNVKMEIQVKISINKKIKKKIIINLMTKMLYLKNNKETQTINKHKIKKILLQQDINYKEKLMSFQKIKIL